MPTAAIDPAQIFDARPGEMFVVRNIAALAPPYETSRGFHGVSAALEFAVSQLEVGEILVMGHGLCGGCAAALTGQFDDTEPGEGHFIADWVRMLHKRGTRSAPGIRSSIATPSSKWSARQSRSASPTCARFPGSRAGAVGQPETPRRAFFDRRGATLRARRGGRRLPPRLAGFLKNKFVSCQLH